MKKLLTTLILIGMLAFPSLAFAQAKIWLTADGASYVDLNSDPWLNQTWVIGSGDFELEIINTSTQDPIYDIMLVLSIPYNSPDTGWSFTLGGETFNYSDFDQDGLHPIIAPHGIFANVDGAKWTEYEVGNIGISDSTKLAFSGTAPDGAYIHFDAFGNNAAGEPVFHNPYSKDFTVTPEPMSLVLYGLGGLPIAVHLLRRRKIGV